MRVNDIVDLIEVVDDGFLRAGTRYHSNRGLKFYFGDSSGFESCDVAESDGGLSLTIYRLAPSGAWLQHEEGDENLCEVGTVVEVTGAVSIEGLCCDVPKRQHQIHFGQPSATRRERRRRALRRRWTWISARDSDEREEQGSPPEGEKVKRV